MENRTKFYMNRLVNNLKVPIIQSIIFSNGDMLIFEHGSFGYKKEDNFRILCKSTVESYFEYNDDDYVSSCYTTTSAEDVNYIVYVGEGSWGGDGLIYVIRKVDGQLVWLLFSDHSNPFSSVELIGDEITAITNLGARWTIPIHSPEKLKIERK